MDINAEVSDMRLALASLEAKAKAQEKPKQWKPTMGLDWVDRAHLSTYTRLLQYVKEFGGGWRSDWKDHSQINYCVQYSNHDNTWEVDGRCTVCVSGTVYMSRECAEGLAAKLNSGEVVL
jgi:hypothetical protein